MIKEGLNHKGVTLIEIVVVSALFLVIMISVIGIYNQSLINLYAVEKISDSQRNAENGLFFISQELAGVVDFYTINSTQFSANTYRNTNVSFYYQAADSTLRRYRGIGFTNGTVISRYVTGVNFTYIADTTYSPTYSPDSVVGVRVQITTNAPASNITDPTSIGPEGFTVSSYIWCRNRKTN
jgi:Tfp pilus assembly protein PilW